MMIGNIWVNDDVAIRVTGIEAFGNEFALCIETAEKIGGTRPTGIIKNLAMSELNTKEKEMWTWFLNEVDGLICVGGVESDVKLMNYLDGLDNAPVKLRMLKPEKYYSLADLV